MEASAHALCRTDAVEHYDQCVKALFEIRVHLQYLKSAMDAKR